MGFTTICYANRKIVTGLFLLNTKTPSLKPKRFHSTLPHPNPQSPQPFTSKDSVDKVDINGLKIRYKILGNGPHTILLLPGIIGSIETDFGPILSPLTKTNAFTVIAWDPPGYGYSRPPDRDFAGDFYFRDAHVVSKLMKKLGYNQYSILGWSNGGVTGGWLASEFPERVTKLVTWGSHAYADDRAVIFSKMMGNLENWSEKMKLPLLNLYGETYLQKMLTDWGKSVENYQKSGLDEGIKKAWKNVQCPSLIIHGEHDPVLGVDHAEFIHRNIPNSVFKIFPEGKHNLHLRFTADFLKLVVPFLLKNS